MKKLTNTSILFVIIFLSACVSQKKYQELEASKNHFQDEYENLRTVKQEKKTLEEELKFTETQLRQSLAEMEQLSALADRMRSENENLIDRYDQCLNQSNSILSNTSAEKLTLEDQLAANQKELDNKQRELNALEFTLNERAQNVDLLSQELNQREQRINDLQAVISAKDAQMIQIRANVDEALRGFTAGDLTVSERNGKIYVSLSQDLLFKPGSDQIDFKGKNAIKQLAEVLAQQIDIDVTVEGHTDNAGSADYNWDLSTQRATSVVKELTKNGLPPHRITAAGRGFYAPIAPNDTAENKAKNRRTEIILSPKLDKLYSILEN